jgi:hypothetical protein
MDGASGSTLNDPIPSIDTAYFPSRSNKRTSGVSPPDHLMSGFPSGGCSRSTTVTSRGVPVPLRRAVNAMVDLTLYPNTVVIDSRVAALTGRARADGASACSSCIDPPRHSEVLTAADPTMIEGPALCVASI